VGRGGRMNQRFSGIGNRGSGIGERCPTPEFPRGGADPASRLLPLFRFPIPDSRFPTKSPAPNVLSASTNATRPFWLTVAMIWRNTVVTPALRCPRISVNLPFGSPPMGSSASRSAMPVATPRDPPRGVGTSSSSWRRRAETAALMGGQAWSRIRADTEEKPKIRGTRKTRSQPPGRPISVPNKSRKGG
jgi:hypothetical protein